MTLSHSAAKGVAVDAPLSDLVPLAPCVGGISSALR